MRGKDCTQKIETPSSLKKAERDTHTSADMIIAKSSLFSKLNDDEIEFVTAHSELLHLSPGEVLYEAGSLSQALYIVRTGSIDIVEENGRLIAQFLAGECFGELELFSGTRHESKARSSAETHLIRFPAKGEDLETVMMRNPTVSARILKSFLILLAGRTRKANALLKENSPWIRELKRQVYGDKLTGLYNKAYLEEEFPQVFPNAPALIMLKPDNFKDINDRFGHEVGDKTLVHIARELSRFLSEQASVIRYEGNELALWYIHCDRQEAGRRALAIKDFLEQLSLEAPTGEKGIRLGISMGIALSNVHAFSAQALIEICAPLPLEGRKRGGSRILWPEDIL